MPNDKLNSVARIWVDALRSNTFKQSRHDLTTVDSDTGEITGHCCLGVLCELAVKAKVIPSPKKLRYCLAYSDATDSEQTSSSILPETVRKWAKLKTRRGDITLFTSLSMLNDIDRLNFEKIADVIEKHANVLFED
jgi:hypothetical protein